MYSSISPPHTSPCIIPQNFSFGFNHDIYYHDLLLHHYNNLTTTTTTPSLMPPTLTNQETHLPNLPRLKKQISKRKDRHCKIVTAQGLRDRRVRLSTAIARQFFDLQDLLGFDKASKTLDWLLTKSRTAIKELQKSVIDEDSESRFGGEKISVHQVLEKSTRQELRAKARTRARERTLEKYCIRKLSQDQEDGVKQLMPKPSSSSPQLGSNWSTCESDLFAFFQLLNNGNEKITSEDLW